MSIKERPSVDGLYEQIFNSMYCARGPGDRVISSILDTAFKIGDREVVFPSKDLLVENDWTKIHPFHPLAEDVLMGQSPTTHFLIKRVTGALTLRVSAMMKNMLQVAASTDLQARLQDGAYVSHLEPANHAKESTVKGWEKIVSSFKTNQFLSLYVSRAVTVGDKTYLRYASLASPFLEDDTDDATLCGVKLASKADKRMIVALLRHLLPKDLLEIGCNGNVPYFESIVTIHRNISKHLNDIVKPFKSLANELDGLKPVKLDWWKWVKDDGLEQFVGLVPSLPGNEGEPEVGRREPKVDPELAGLLGRSELPARAKADNTPPWNDDAPAAPRAIEKASSGGGLDIMARSAPSDDRDRDYDRGRGRGSDVPRVDIFNTGRRRNERDDRYGRDRDDRYSRRDREDDRSSRRGGGIDIMGGGSRRR